MKRQLRWFIFGLAIVILFMASGCLGGDNAPYEDQSSEADLQTALHTLAPSSEAYPPARPLVLGFSQLGSESDWREANTTSIKEAAEEAGIELLFENAEQSQEKQFEAIRSFIDKRVDVIAIAPVVHSGWDEILTEAKQAGIPVIITDRSIDISDPSLYVTHIGADLYEEGVKAGKYLLDKMRDQEAPIGIVELRGTEGSSPSIQRGKGFQDTIKGYDEYRMLDSETADFTMEKGKQVMKTFLRKHGSEIRVLFAHNDDMALGAIEAIEEYGLRPGKDIVIISVDGTRKAFEKLVLGKINCVVECNPLLGPNIMQAVQELAAGRTLPKRIVSSESVFTEQMAEKEVGNRKY
ncbi:ABC transporter substrate-binding protein [Paenibacillus harenae]|uniref:Simple sugar transport system substrate-binding protein n=1 Tax=Paenibacillus harenae TaxID=306543 RepID=A0ABT9TVR7_PAEHA|nr:ABC transporter substrate-binding protein [Paenibacillus harenae]MDQ0058110.1 simple sugar transport system substrate-binding protein [Paenibacillus harenae]MDQ0111455.1 simple sugar transport system substrate-binding protein [Paenibacillus harenae]